MLIIGLDYHPSFQQIAFVDTETGDTGGSDDWNTHGKPRSSTAIFTTGPHVGQPGTAVGQSTG